MHWAMNLSNAVGARLCEPQRVATAPSPAGHRPALRDGRFIERILALDACSGTMNPPLTPPRRGTGADERSLPSWEGSGVGRFMERPPDRQNPFPHGTLCQDKRYFPRRQLSQIPFVLARTERLRLTRAILDEGKIGRTQDDPVVGTIRETFQLQLCPTE